MCICFTQYLVPTEHCLVPRSIVKEVITRVGKTRTQNMVEIRLFKCRAENDSRVFFPLFFSCFFAFVPNSLNLSLLFLGQVNLKEPLLTLMISWHIKFCFLVLVAEDVFTAEKKGF